MTSARRRDLLVGLTLCLVFGLLYSCYSSYSLGNCLNKDEAELVRTLGVPAYDTRSDDGYVRGTSFTLAWRYSWGTLSVDMRDGRSYNVTRHYK